MVGLTKFFEPFVTVLDQEMSLIPVPQRAPRGTEESGLLSSLITDAFGDARYTDFAIQCQGRIFRVHRLVICKQSRYFELACEIDMMEKHAGIIELVEEDPNVVYRILRYMYTGQLALGQDPDGDENDKPLDEAIHEPDESTVAMLDDAEGMTLAEALGEMGAEDKVLDLEDNDTSGDWVTHRDVLDDADTMAAVDADEDDKDEDDNTSDLSDDAKPDVLYPADRDEWPHERAMWGPPNHFANAREEEDDRVNDQEEDGLNACQTQRLLNMIHLYAAADRLQVGDMKQDIAAIFREEYNWKYFSDQPITALQLAKDVYSTTPDRNRGLRDTVLEVIKFESPKLVVHLKDTMTELFRIVPQLAFDLFQDATITDRSDEVVQERHYRLHGSLPSDTFDPLGQDKQSR